MKNKFMRIAAVMLMLCLVTTCAISGTFAKYTTKGSGEDTARVAYWGWTEGNMTTGLEIDELFVNAYDNDAVKSTADVIAPGTTNNVDFSIAYTPNGAITAPEVAYSFIVSTAGSECAQEIEDNENIKWYLDDVACDNWDDLLADIAALSQSYVAAGQLPSGFGDGNSHNIKWEWVFHTGDAQDVEDTTMGNTANLNVKIVITVTATQLDTIPTP